VTPGTGHPVMTARDGVAPDWADIIGDDVPVLASRPWIRATAQRLSPDRMTFLVQDGARAAGLQAAVVTDPAAYETYNLYRMLFAEPQVFKFPADAVGQRRALREKAAPARQWFPNLAVLYPGYDCFVASMNAPAGQLTRSLVDGIWAWASDQGLRAVSFLYVAADSDLATVLAERGFHRLPLTFRTVLPVTGGFDEYLGRLPRKRAAEIRRERRRLGEAGIRTRRCDPAEYFTDILTLRCSLVGRYGHPVNPDKEARNLGGLIECFGPDGVCLYCSFAGAEPVGFSLFVVWNGTRYAAYTGTLSRPDTRFAYFDHLIYVPYEGAAAERGGCLDLGVGAWQAKHARGCALMPADIWASGLDAAVDRSIELAGTAMVPEDGATAAAGRSSGG
jgi:hypothetical protein